MNPPLWLSELTMIGLIFVGVAIAIVVGCWLVLAIWAGLLFLGEAASVLLDGRGHCLRLFGGWSVGADPPVWAFPGLHEAGHVSAAQSIAMGHTVAVAMAAGMVETSARPAALECACTAAGHSACTIEYLTEADTALLTALGWRESEHHPTVNAARDFITERLIGEVWK